MSNAIYPAAVRGMTYPILRTSRFGTVDQRSAGGDMVTVAQMTNPLWTWELIYEYIKDDPADLVASLSPYTDYQVMRGFILSKLGKFDSFLFNDPRDNFAGPRVWIANQYYAPGTVIIDPAGHKQTASTPGGISGATVPTFSTGGGTVTDGTLAWTDGGVFVGSTAQAVPLVSASGVSYSPLQRNFGGLFLEDITDLNATTTPLRVWANGTLKTLTTDYVVAGPGLAIPGYSYSGKYLQWTGTPTGPITVSFQFYFRVHFADDASDMEQFLNTVFCVGGDFGQGGKGSITIESFPPAII